MIIAVGSDHRGFEVKEIVKSLIKQLGHEVIDVGAKDSHPVDYPDAAFLAAEAVSKGKADRGILTCATGLGMCIAANKIKGVRAAICHDELTARISRDHNDTNVLCLSGDQIGEGLLRKIVEVWLDTEFSGGRHERRIRKINSIEDGKDPSKIKKSPANNQ